MTTENTSQSNTKSQRKAYAADQSQAVDTPVDLSDEMSTIGAIQANLEAYKTKFHRNRSKTSASDKDKKSTSDPDSKGHAYGSGHPARIMADNQASQPSNRSAYNVEFDFQIFQHHMCYTPEIPLCRIA